MSTAAYTGEINKQIRVNTNDPRKERVTFTLKAKVVEVLKVTPRTVNFGKIPQNGTFVCKIDIENLGKEPLKVVSADAKPPALLSLDFTEPFVLEPGQKKTLGITLSSGTSRGIVHGYVRFETDLKDLPGKVVRVRAEVKDDPGNRQ
ncbi:MAG: hypothetical protein WAP34_15330 [Desulfomonilia bacterium]|jgi:hypothetical protein